MRDVQLRLKLSAAKKRERNQTARTKVLTNHLQNVDTPVKGDAVVINIPQGQQAPQPSQGFFNSISRRLTKFWYGEETLPPVTPHIVVKEGVSWRKKALPVNTDNEVRGLLAYARDSLFSRSKTSSNARDTLATTSSFISAILQVLERTIDDPVASKGFYIATAAVNVVFNAIGSLILPLCVEFKAAELHVVAEDGLLQMDAEMARASVIQGVQNNAPVNPNAPAQFVTSHAWDTPAHNQIPDRVTIPYRSRGGKWGTYTMWIHDMNDVVEATRLLDDAINDTEADAMRADNVKIILTIIKALIVGATSMARLGLDPVVNKWLSAAIVILELTVTYITAIDQEQTIKDAVRERGIAVDNKDTLDTIKNAFQTMSM